MKNIFNKLKLISKFRFDRLNKNMEIAPSFCQRSLSKKAHFQCKKCNFNFRPEFEKNNRPLSLNRESFSKILGIDTI
ncbi:hypothetical protein BUQ74_03855 [Leptospira weilii serovar Heyan]|nr:hypothetical protein BUQ74_03855 [Leptospira weilii serovar Heyan]